MLRPLACLLFVLGLGASAAAQSVDPDEEPVMGTSHPLPDGVTPGDPDEFVVHSESPDSNLATAADPDATTVGSSQPIEGHSIDPDAITTRSEDLTDLPSASEIDRPLPAAIADSSLPLSCGQPAGDPAWYSRSLTLHVPTGQARADVIRERDQARADVKGYSSMLASQLEQAEQAGASQSVTAPYRPQVSGW
jgi:hypothetical protein